MSGNGTPFDRDYQNAKYISGMVDQAVRCLEAANKVAREADTHLELELKACIRPVKTAQRRSTRNFQNERLGHGVQSDIEVELEGLEAPSWPDRSSDG